MNGTKVVEQAGNLVLVDSYTDDDMVAEWVGLHYGKIFDKMSAEDKDAYRERFVEMHNSQG